jgi:hypothetical protein
MNDDLESELAAFRPVSPSTTLEQRLAQRLNRPTAPPRPVGRPLLALAAWVIAASVLLMLVRPHPEPRPSPIAPQKMQEAPLPTYAAFRRALAESPEAFDALLCHGSDRPVDSAAVTIKSDLDLFH